MLLRAGIAVLLLSTVASIAQAGQILPAGPEFRLSRGSNGYTSDGYAQYPRITNTPGGEFVVVWKSYYSTYNGYARGVAARRLNRDGTPKGPQFDVSPPYPDDDPTLPDVTSTSDGGFVVVWQAWDYADENLWFRRFAPNDAPVGPPVGVAEEDRFYAHGIATLPGDGFVIVWTDYGGEVRGQRFDAGGTALDGGFVASTYSGKYPTVASDTAGNFVVAWDGSYAYFRRFDAGGVPQGDVVTIGDDGWDGFIHPALDVDGAGNFVVVEDTHPSTSYALWGHTYDATGAPRGPEFMVGNEDGFLTYPAVAYDADGAFVVTWMDETQYTLHVARYNATGVQDGPIVPVNPYAGRPPHLVRNLDLATDVAGDFVVVWANGDNPSTYGVFGRRFTVCGNGRVGVGTECDDGNVDPGDGCSATCTVETCHTCTGEPSVCPGIAACEAVCSAAAAMDAKTFLTVKRILPPAGDESLTLKGRIVAPPVPPGTYNPAVDGAEVVLTGDSLFYGRAGTTAVPPGLVGTGCGPLDGWKVGGRAPNFSYTYKNLTNALPPACVAGSANGLRVVKFKDKLAVDGTLQVQLQLKNATLPAVPPAPLTATIVLGRSPDAGLAGRCARIVLTEGIVTGSSARFYPPFN